MAAGMTRTAEYHCGMVLNLTGKFEKIVEPAVAEGRYSSAERCHPARILG
jgi:hypothetical protein